MNTEIPGDEPGLPCYVELQAPYEARDNDSHLKQKNALSYQERAIT
jgi:hypothetical protein